MKGAFILAIGLLAAADNAPEIAAKYFSFTREVRAAEMTAKQPYVAIDEAIWNGSENGLSDVRFYEANREVPYALVVEGAKSGSSETPARILNKGMVNGQLEFVIESPLDEVDTLKMELKTRDFASRAEVAGADQLPTNAWADLGTFSIFDFTNEQLGRNWAMKLNSPVRYKYFRLRIPEAVKFDDVLSAAIADQKREKARYTSWSTQPAITQQGNKTVIAWPGSDRVPLEHVEFTVDPAEVNFRRNAILSCGHRDKSAATARDILTFDRSYAGELTRVRMTRKGHKIEYESLELEPGMQHCEQYKIEIQNENDPALKITAVVPQFIERRLYWNAQLAKTPKLLYGDKKADAPRYDFAKFFDEPDANDTVRAELSPEAKNAEFVARGDDRPFTERYPALMWGAMIVAVLGLGAWAVKGFKP